MKEESLPTNIAFVDIETSGPRVTSDRIIEIGILRVENNALARTYQTLINPQTYISPYIENYTGIRKEELRQAPNFEAIHETIQELLNDCVFVAHNVRFDYSFLRNEFARLGVSFSQPHFCTLRLSKQLFPQLRRHGLDALIDRFALSCPARHRAMSDASVLWQFYQSLFQQFNEETVTKAVRSALKRPAIPNQLKPDMIRTLPTQSGVYIFYDANGYPLYVGKSKNIRERVFSHFTSDYASTKEMAICQQVESVEAHTTSGELGALLEESLLVKKLQPLYNRKLRHTRELTIAKRSYNAKGYATVCLETVEQINVTDMEDIIGVFKSKKQAKEALLVVAKEHGLCHKLLQLEKATMACFPYQLGWCRGACIAKESFPVYNLRFDTAFARSRIKPWPFSGPIVIREEDEEGEGRAYLVNKWCLLGHVEHEYPDTAELHQDIPFDLDTYKILVQYITSPKNQKNIRVLSLK